MSELPPSGHDVVVVESRPAGGGERSFRLEAPEEGDAPDLPADLAHERELVDAMKAAGYRLTMVGGGSREDEVRRFYFRPAR